MTTPKRGAHRRDLTAFYAVVALIALLGQALGAVEILDLPFIPALAAAAALEFGGVVLSRHAVARMRLGERAIPARLGSAAVAAFAVVFNWIGHGDHRAGGFFAGMSALGYVVWLLDSSARRRDELRALRMLPDVPPAYELVGHWLRHPWITLRARNLAKADPQLGLYHSLECARAEKRKEERTAAIAKVLHRKIRSAVDPTTADIAVAVYDLDEIAVRLADGADYVGLTALIGADLAPARLTATTAPLELEPAPEAPAEVQEEPAPEPPAELRVRPADLEREPEGSSPGGSTAPRRTADETRRLAAAMKAGDPALTQKQIAAALGITPRYLRELLPPAAAEARADGGLRLTLTSLHRLPPADRLAAARALLGGPAQTTSANGAEVGTTTER